MNDYTKRSLDGSLRDSTVARLLMDGKLPAEGSSNLTTDDPMDLSSKSKLLGGSTPPHTLQQFMKTEPGEKDHFHALSVEMLRINMNNEMEKLKQGAVSDHSNSTWKCRYCPYMAPTSNILLSHYQFHQQLLSSQSSRPHIEWLTAYRKAKEAEKTDECGDPDSKVPMFGYPTTGLGSSYPSTAFSLRHLLGNKNDNQHSASSFLRSIVQAVMQQGNTPGQGPSSSSIYASLVKDQDRTQTESDPTPVLLGPPSNSDDAPSGGEIKRKGSKRKAAAPSVPAVQPKYHTNEREKDFSVSSCSEGGPSSAEDPRSPSTASSASRSTASSPISVGDDLQMQPRSQLAGTFPNANLACDLNYRCPDVEAVKSPYNSPSDFQRTALSPALSWSDTASEQAQVQLDKTLSTRRCSTDSDDSNISSASKELGTPKGQLGGAAKSSPDPMCHRNSNTQTSGFENSRKFDFTNMSKNYDSLEQTQDYEEEYMKGTWCGHRAIQCSLLVSPGEGSVRSTRTYADSGSFSGDESVEGFLMDDKTKGVIKCDYCGISFEDEVLHSIHMGCHSHTDPYSCNVCGRNCGNRYGFYTHIMRGHHP